MNPLIDQGVAKGLIAFDADQKNITYKIQNKRFRFNDSEEKVRANAYLSLVLEYGYTPEQIDIEVAVEHRVPNIYSDIVVYADKSLKKPLILVECKREEASQGELEQAIEQGFGYANSMDADWVWMTSGIRNDYFIRDRKAPSEIFQLIENSGYLIADLTAGNKNVYHELGLLMGLNQGQAKEHDNFLLVHNTFHGNVDKDIGFNVAHLKQLRQGSEHTIGKEVKKQVAIYYRLAVTW